MDRDDLIRQFVHDAGWSDASIGPLAGDASNRRYLRLRRANTSAVLMDAPPLLGEDVRPFVAMTEWLLDHGFSAPALLAQDADTGFLLLEDLGDTLFARHLVTAARDEATLYREAISVLVRMADIPAPQMVGRHQMPLPPYDRATLDREAGLFTEWYLSAQTTVSQDMATEFRALVGEATRHVEDSRQVVVMRDYHAENLVWLPDRPSPVGLLDYQDALAGHPAYDLVSLLEDARRDTSDTLQSAMLDMYLAESLEDRESFLLAYAALGAQRNLKIIGIFTRLAIRDRKPAYLSLIPRVWDHLQRDLAFPALSPLARWIERYAAAPSEQVLAHLEAAIPA